MQEKKSKKSKVFRITVALLASIAIWVYVDGINTTSVTTQVRNIPVEFTGEDTELADKNLMLLSGYDTTVDLTLRGPRSVLVNLDKSEMRILADTSTIDGVGSQTLNYQVVYPDNIPRNAISVSSASIYSVTVTVGTLTTKEIPVHCEVTGEVANGYFRENLILDPVHLVLRGQRDDLINISYAKVKLDISKAESTVIRTLEYTLYDYNDMPVTGEGVRTSTQLIQAVVPVKTTKEVALKINFREEPGSTLQQTEYTISPQKVTLRGEKATLADIDSIVLDTIYLQDLNATQDLVYNIPVPEGTELVEEIGNAIVSITMKGVSEVEMPVTQFNLQKVPEGYVAEMVTTSLTVQLRGLTTELDAMTEESLTGYLDLSAYSTAGEYTVPVQIKVNGFDNIGVKGSYQAVVRINAKPAAE
ncbi:MAG: hypothetical protein E7457_06660 [Ruminococcaceae bacterium]|nr:hypothetical protein [Oscillospiraceae bacterium]